MTEHFEKIEGHMQSLVRHLDIPASTNEQAIVMMSFLKCVVRLILNRVLPDTIALVTQRLPL